MAVFTRYFHAKIILFLFVINKYVMGGYFESM